MDHDQQGTKVGSRPRDEIEQVQQGMLGIQSDLREKDPREPAVAHAITRRSAKPRAFIAICAAAGILVVAIAVVAVTQPGQQPVVASGESSPAVTAEPAPAEPAAAAPAPTGQPIAPAPQVVLDNATVPFASDTAKLTDPGTAKRTLSAIAESVVASGARITLTGTTATDGTRQGRAQLSLDRAEAVKTILVSLGLPAGSITTKGVGINHPSHIADLDKNGRLIPDQAAKNRTVILTVQAA